MSFARGSQRGLLYQIESAVGTPNTADMKTLRNTGDSLTVTKNNFQSGELRSDRAITDVTMGNTQTSGGMDIELSVDNFDDFLAMVLYDDGDGRTTAYGTPLADGEYIQNGVTETSCTIQKSFTGVTYQRYSGMHANSLSLNIAADSQITGSFDFVGMGYDAQGSTYETGTTTDASTGGLFTSHSLVLNEGGSVINTAVSLSLNISNNLNAAFVLGSTEAQEVIDGRCMIDGSLVIYFEDTTIYDKFMNETESSLSFSLSSVEGGTTTTYTFNLPRVKYTSADDPVSDEGVVSVTMNFSALQDDAAGYTMRITKAIV